VLEFVSSLPARGDDYVLELAVDGQTLPSSTNVDVNRARFEVGRRVTPGARDRNGVRVPAGDDTVHHWWDLQEFRGRTVELAFRLRAGQGSSQITWRSIAVRSAVTGLSSKLPQPDVLLSALEPLEAASHKERGDPAPNELPTRRGEPITFVGQAYSGGYGMMRNSQISFAIQPDYRRFVALVGTCTEQSGGFRVLVDGRVAWETSTRPAIVGAEWIEIALPAGAEKITLETGPDGGYHGYSAFAPAGFMKWRALLKTRRGNRNEPSPYRSQNGPNFGSRFHPKC
jgi:hypothetical protein